MNLVANNPITTKDIVLEERIFGPDINAIKGRTTRTSPILKFQESLLPHNMQ
jgi:hypothetical protein